MDWLAVGKFLAETFGAVGGVFVATSAFLLRELIGEYKDRRQDSVKMTEAVTLSTSVLERVITVLDKRQ
jgi:hypothetical protein